MSEHTEVKHEDEPASIFSDSYDAKQFKKDMTSGQLRWMATVLSVVNAGLLAFDFLFSEEHELYFPIHLKGAAVVWLLSATLLVWSSLAFVNWKNWAATRRAR